MEEKAITYLRPTGINTYLECGAKYYFQEIEKMAVPNKSYLAFGTSIHQTLKENFAYKIITKTDLEIEEAKQIFSEVFDKEFENVDKIDLAEEKPGLIKDQGIKLIEKYQKEVSPRIIPAAVEQKIKVKFKNYDYGLAGTIDLYDTDNQIIDHKTTSKEINGKIPISYQRQISAYAILEEAAGHKVEGARIDYLKRDTTEIRHLKVEIDKEHFLRIFQTVGDAIKNGVFIPNRNSFLCTKRYCKYYAECERKYGGTVKN
ncbi:MAG: PD-(D/E)XK nuclease family protein [Candidatus Pacearchaeota archaeon]